MRFVIGLAALSLAACEPKKTTFAYITNGIDPFWDIAAAGAKAGARDLGVACDVRMPAKGIQDQKTIVESLVAGGISGIAISPIDGKNQVDLINDASSRTLLITQDSDAPDSKRLCFIGMNNYKAGRQAGKLVKEAMPEGGKVMIFVGRLEQINAQQRRQGVIDELLDRPEQSLSSLTLDPAGAGELKGPKYSVLGTRTDNFDKPKAKANAEDAMAAVPDLGCMVGLFAYNPPLCLEAVKQAGKIGKIKLVAFDEQDATLQAIVDGQVQGTVSQQPFRYGYESVRVLDALSKGDKSVIPASKFLEVPSIVVRKDNVGEFWANLKKLKGGG